VELAAVDGEAQRPADLAHRRRADTADRWSRSAFLTSWTLSRLATEAVRMPSSGPRGTSVETPRAVRHRRDDDLVQVLAHGVAGKRTTLML
jgi:hypothetical protein